MACKYTYKGKTYEAWEFDDVLKAMPPIEAAKYMKGVKPIKEPVSLSGKQIAWLRVNQREDDKGNSGLFLEEVQSQRGRRGKTEGFKGESKGFGIYYYGKDFNEFFDDKREAESRLKELKESHPDESSKFEIKEKIGVSDDKTKVPPAPFITSATNKATDAYILLLMKKALSAAIDNEQSFVSWTTGEQQAVRYNLGQVIDRLFWIEPSGVMMAYKGEETVGRYTEVTRENLHDFIGADLAGEMLKSPADDRGGRRLENISMKAGSPEWTKTMYGNSQGLDGNGKPSLILQAANELSRKFGGKTGTVTLSTGEQPALFITPEMREKILGEGMPLFSYAGQKATNADKSALASAVEMEQQGIDNETIRKETGWFLEQPDTLQIFKDLDSRTPAKVRNQSLQDVLSNPNADRIMYINDNIVDILAKLEGVGGFEIKC